MEPRRILFASVPFDGHFNPLTGIAAHLQSLGHDVRWYAGPSYADRLSGLGIPHFPFRAAREINGSNVHEHFPERGTLKGLKLLRFEFKHVIVANTGAYFDDVADIRDNEFPFDALVCDGMFYGYALVAQALRVPVHVVQPAPMLFSSPDTPPNFAGLTPAKTAAGRFAHRRLRTVMEKVSMGAGMAVFNQAFTDRGLEAPAGSIFDLPLSCATLAFQSGVPGFSYPRRQLSTKVVFAGPLFPYRSAEDPPDTFTQHLRPGRKVVVISQGTVDNQDATKLISPALDALRDSGHVLFVATGGANTAELRQAYPDDGIIIEDYLDFARLFEHADLFICNGGYGSILLSLTKGVPVLSAGIREGKNDVNAHIRYFGVGIDLRTEQPKPAKIRRAVDTLLRDQSFKANVAGLAAELNSYDPNTIITERLIGAQDLGPRTIRGARHR